MDWDYENPFTLVVTAGNEHIDGLHHVNNAVYVTWCEKTAWQHSESLGLSLEDYQTLGRAMAIRHSEYDYLQAAYENDDITIGTWLKKGEGRQSMERHFQFIRNSDQVTLLRGHWQLVCIDINTGRPKRLPPEFVEAYCNAFVEA